MKDEDKSGLAFFGMCLLLVTFVAVILLIACLYAGEF